MDALAKASARYRLSLSRRSASAWRRAVMSVKVRTAPPSGKATVRTSRMVPFGRSLIDLRAHGKARVSDEMCKGIGEIVVLTRLGLELPNLLERRASCEKVHGKVEKLADALVEDLDRALCIQH